MAYNFLREARTIKNSALCRYDTLNGYETDFSQNGDVDGWNIYYNVYLYGCWNDTIFGTTYDRSCYVSRTNVFQYVSGEDYYFVRLMMKLTDNNPNKTVPTLTTGRIQWVTLNNPAWSSTQQLDFDLVVDNKWHLYEINMGPATAWQGYINNLRVYPFIDGVEGDQFAIKSIKIGSYDKWVCKNTSCSYYSSYEHNCPGAGKRASAEAGITKSHYTTISGVSDKLIVNIDSYGEEEFDLGNNSNLNGVEMARVISNALGRLNMGGYIFSEAEYSENDELKISSGNVGSQSSIVISDTPAARALGFFDGDGNNVSTIETGVDSATGFDYAASRIFTGIEINKMVDDNMDNVAYLHNPDQFNVEGGRRDFNEIGISRLISNLVNTAYYESLNNKGKTIVDLSHPINNNGRLKAIYIYGQIEDDSPAKIKICRPHRNGELTVIHSLDLPTKESNKIYTTYPLSYKIDCNVLVSKGDLIGVYNADLYVGVSMTGLPDATFYQVSGNISGKFDPGKPYSFGVAGLAVYGRSDRYQTNSILEIDMGNRVNIEQIDIYGKESSGYYDFNLCSCLDVSWDVNLFGESHHHLALRWTDGTRQTFTHTNIAYGEDCLDDMVITADNGKQGDSYYTDNGVATSGPHAYFYVNGDAEWLYSYACTGRTEFCNPWFPELLAGFERDPVQFTFLFPNERTAKIHKSIMYFKEKDNFRKFELSYYLGADDSTGNTYDNNYNYIPLYNEVLLNGMSFNSTNNEFVAPYLFRNPTSDDSIYSDGKIQNPEVIQAAYTLDWTILEHRFNEIECRGFRIRTNKHHSTKIMELEVYSRIQTDPSLLDNTTLSFSDYGDVWKSAPFTEISTDQLSAFIGGAPRYFRLELESKNKFNLNEIKMLVGDQVKLENCDDTVLLEESKTYATNTATPVVLENVYDKPFDLIVDLPKETQETSDIIFWSKCDSMGSLDNPEIGPACFLRKEDDYIIRNDNNQCAINVPGYGLKNLIDGKSCYYSYTNGDLWTFSGTLSSGVSLAFACKNPYILESTLSFTGVSSKYWQITSSVGGHITLDYLGAFYNDNELNIYNLQSDYRSGNYIPILVNDATGSVVSTNWTEYQSQAGDNLNLSFDGIEAVSYGSATGGPYIETILTPNLTDFTMAFDFMSYRMVDDRMAHITIDFYDSVGTLIIQWILTDSEAGSNVLQLMLYEKGVLLGNYDVTGITYNDGVRTNKAIVQRSGSNLLLKIDNNVIYNGVFAIEAIHKIDIRLQRSAGYTPADKLAVYFGNSFCFDLNTSESMNILKLKHVGNLSDDVDIYTSADSITYTKWDDASFTLHNSTFYDYFAVDLENRHVLDFIRNYGDSTGKLLLDGSVLDYSNTDTSNIYDVEWNSSEADARWVRFNLLSGDGVDRYLRKLGIYPDVSVNACLDGDAYNCEWEDLGYIFGDYTPSINVAYGATVTGTNNYFGSWYPTYAVDGVSDNYSMGECWGFQKEGSTDPYLEIDLGQTRTIYQVKLYHGYNPDDSDYMNKNYTVSVSTSMSGSFTDVVNITNNSDFYRMHQFTPVEARRVRLTITSYDYTRLLYYNESTDSYDVFNGSFLREMEVYTYPGISYVDSETWPVVCVNLLEPFNITDHGLINKDINDTDTDWDNDEDFFKYSDNLLIDPKKVSFGQSGQWVTSYVSTDDSDNMMGESEYIFDINQFFTEGRYRVYWEAYGPSDGEISLRLDGNQVVDLFADNLGSGWLDQDGIMDVPEDGFYDVKGVQHIDPRVDWRVKDPLMQRAQGHIKWVSVKRDTATNYSYDDDSGKYGKDYLNLIKVYGDTKYNPTEYHWWWHSTLSTLSNDYMNVKVHSRSLQIDYPTSSGADTISFLEGDDFGQDVYWSVKDSLSFWWRIDDVSKLDTIFGDITFGSVNESSLFYYKWDISSLNLISGWNLVKLKFDDYNVVYPETENFYMNPFMDERLDLLNNGQDLKSFVLRYRGKGSPFTMHVDDLRIRRNVFEDDVKFGKGLCLTGREYLDIPAAGLTLEQGTVEFWLKTYYDSYGRDVFGNTASKTFFTIVNNNNDIVSLGIKASQWFQASSGNLRTDLNLFDAEYANLREDSFVERDEVVHIALAWSNDSKFMDNDQTLRLYINGELLYVSNVQWEVSDTKSVNIKFGGSNAQISYAQDSYGAGIFDNIKIYNYAKDTFKINTKGVAGDVVYTPNEFLQVSSDNVNFHGIGSSNLPFIFEQILPGEKQIVYVRSSKDQNFKQSKKTASLIVSWLTTV
jgi:hypothetical protein